MLCFFGINVRGVERAPYVAKSGFNFAAPNEASGVVPVVM
jgi:hypothetical protein